MVRFSLPIKTDVFASSYLFHAFPLCIIQAQPEFRDTWICDKMINFVYRDGVLSKFAVYNTDWHFGASGAVKEYPVYFSIDSVRTIQLIDFVRESLHNGLYVAGQHNERYIQGKYAYMSYDWMHEFLIFGDDPENQVFQFVGYLADTPFCVYEVSYQDYINSLYNVENKGMYFSLRRPQQISYDPDIKMILHGLSDYYTSRDTVRYDKNGIFGFEAMEHLAGFIEEEAEGHGKIDQRYIRSYFEHKNMMSIRMRYLADNGLIDKSIADDYIPIKQTAEKIHFLTIKYNMMPQQLRMQKIKDMILSNQAEELHIFDKIQPMLKLS